MPEPGRRLLPKPRFDHNLPILQRRAEIERAIADHQVVVVCGETGSGKTTQLAQICLALGRGSKGIIAHTQPRRLAARAVAARIAEELSVPLGGSVGVKVRFDDQTSSATCLKLMTDGMLLAETAGDPSLLAYDTIIIDEAHERSLNIDFLLGYLRRLLPRRPDLKIIITSATIDPARFSAHFALPGKPAPPVIEVSGRTFPVEVRYMPGGENSLFDAGLVRDAINELPSGGRSPSDPRDILVFLPGEREIRECERALKGARIDADILPVYSRLSSAEQDRIFHPENRQRVLLATNVAETSLTIPGIRYVIDSGLARISRYDTRARVQRLPIEPVSKASALQRSGRCGRVAAGVCIRLYSERSFAERSTFTEPEIRRTNLAGVILQMKSLNLGPIADFPFLDPPDTQAIREGYETLFELGALDSRELGSTLSPLGRRMARLPTDPRVSRMLIAGADEGALAETLILGAALSIQDPRERPLAQAESADRAHLVYRHPTSDFFTLLNIWNDYHHAADELTSGPLRDWCRQRFLNPTRMREWDETCRQLRSVADDLDLHLNRAPASEERVHRALIPGLIPHICCKEGSSTYDYRAARGNAVSIFPGSVLFKKNPKWFVAGELVETTRLYARTLATIEPEWIEALAAHVLTRTLSDEHFDPETGRPSAWERLTLNGLVIVPRRRVELAGSSPEAARRLFISKHLLRPSSTSPNPIERHNAAIFETAQIVAAKLRRNDALADADTLTHWFDSRLPTHIADTESFNQWCIEHPGHAQSLELTARDALAQNISPPDPSHFPDSIRIDLGGSTIDLPLAYALHPGKETDGLTLTIPLASLSTLLRDRAEWLVPGHLAAKIHALLKQLPKSHRAAFESRAPSHSLDQLARDAAALMDFAKDTLPSALSETIAALTDTQIAPNLWQLNSIPDHLRLRVRIVDTLENDHQLGASRDLDALFTQFEPRASKARAALAQSLFQRQNITEWNFPPLPEFIDIDAPGAPLRAFPAIVDNGGSVALRLAPTAALATLHTRRGVRRLFALACKDELLHTINAQPAIADIRRWYAALAPAHELDESLAALVAESVFLIRQSAVTSRDEFEQRLQSGYARLAQAAIEVVDVVSRTLEPRARVAQRLSGGTPRLWAASIADIREQATYLMPRSFLAMIEWERLRPYPRYALNMRERLLRLREDGSGSETEALTLFAPAWKRLTAWIARAMASQRDDAHSTFITIEPSAPKDAKPRAALPQTRRQSPVVNTDAGEWSLRPASLPSAIAHYRWQLEDARLIVFADTFDRAKAQKTLLDLDNLWSKAQSSVSS